MAIVTTIALATPAFAATVATDGQTLAGGGPGTGTSWDVVNGTSYDDQCVIKGGDSFSPVYDGSVNGKSDAFDGGMGIVVGYHNYIDKDNSSDLTTHSYGQTLSTGASTFHNLKVSEKVTAFSDKPVLRQLVKFANDSNSAIKRQVVSDSAMGSDSDTAVRSSSTHDKNFSKDDRWVVTSDDPASPSDPPVAHIFVGSGHPRKHILDVPFKVSEDPPGDGEYCVDAVFAIKVPAHSSVSLMFFSGLTQSNDSAKNLAKTFNTNRSTYLRGMTRSEKNHVLNWDL